MIVVSSFASPLTLALSPRERRERELLKEVASLDLPLPAGEGRGEGSPS